MKKSKTKKIIARELLLFFSFIVIIGLIFLFLLLRNNYYIIQKEKLNNKIIELTDNIRTLPTDRISWLYDIVNDELVENYEFESDKYAISKWQEKDFIRDFPNATHLDIYPEGYSYFKVNSVIVDKVKIKYRTETEIGDKLKKIFNRYSEVPSKELGKEILKTRNPEKDSVILFDFVRIEQFRSLVSDTIYQRHFFNTFSNDLSLNGYSEYQEIIEEGLRYSEFYENKKEDIRKDIDKYQNDIERVNRNELSNESVFDFLKWIIIIIGFLIYPIRLIIIIILWSIKIIKTPHNK